MNMRGMQFLIAYGLGYSMPWITEAVGGLWSIAVGLVLGLLAGYVVAKLD